MVRAGRRELGHSSSIPAGDRNGNQAVATRHDTFRVEPRDGTADGTQPGTTTAGGICGIIEKGHDQAPAGDMARVLLRSPLTGKRHSTKTRARSLTGSRGIRREGEAGLCSTPPYWSTRPTE